MEGLQWQAEATPHWFATLDEWLRPERGLGMKEVLSLSELLQEQGLHAPHELLAEHVFCTCFARLLAHEHLSAEGRMSAEAVRLVRLVARHSPLRLLKRDDLQTALACLPCPELIKQRLVLELMV